MTYAQALDQSRRFARVTDSGASDTHVRDLINKGLVQFGTDVGGFPKYEYPSISAMFDLRTNMAFHLKVTGGTAAVDDDVVITAANADNRTGAQTATILQVAIRAACGGATTPTVSWTSFYFTLAISDATTIAITPSSETTNYSDASAMIWGGSKSGTTSVTGGFPEGCTRKIQLDEDVSNISIVQWETLELIPSPRYRRVWDAGTPSEYTHDGEFLYLWPCPNVMGRLYIEYKAVPTEQTPTTDTITGATHTTTTVDGLSAPDYAKCVAGDEISGTDIPDGTTISSLVSPSAIVLSQAATGTTAAHTLTLVHVYDFPEFVPDRYHIAICYWVAHQLLMETFETEMSSIYYGKYMKEVSKCKVIEGNKQTEPKEPGYVQNLWYRVSK